MKILALTKYDSLGASSRMRILQYVPYLEKHKFVLEIHNLFDNKYVQLLQNNKRSIFSIIKSYTQRIGVLITSKKYDLIWIEKEALPWTPFFIENFFIPSNTPYIIDYDDAVFHWYDKSDNPLIKFFLKDKHSLLISKAISVIVGNSYLGNYCQNAQAKNIKYLPTAVNFEKYKDLRPKKRSLQQPPIIGWIGQQSTAYNLKPLRHIFEKLVAEESASLSLIGIDGKFLDFPVTSFHWSEDSEVDNIAKFDIGIMPLQDGPFERGKCGYKLIQYMSCGIPVIGSGVGENIHIIDHGVNGFIANNSVDWAKYLQTLINDPDLRVKMGTAGREKILKEYRTYITAPQLADLFKSLITPSR